MSKAEWRDRDFKKHAHPPKEYYVMFEELFLPGVGVIARIEQFKTNDRCFYATTPNSRSGCLSDYEYAKQWCEHNSGNKVN
jgi:hypothetical protein